MRYQPFVHGAVVALLIRVRGNKRRELLDFITALGTNPLLRGDFQKPIFGRELQVKVMGKHSLYYWSDHAVKEVKIVELLESDR